MYMSANENRRLRAAKTARTWLFLSLFVLLFSVVYEHFSFGVWSGYMAFACAVPLALGGLPWAVNAARTVPAIPSDWTRRLWTAGVVTLTVGCLFRGILDIYGTTSALGVVYWIAGTVFLILALLSLLRRRGRAGQRQAVEESA